MKKIVRILLGLFFIVSAWLKLESLDSFKILILDYFHLESWNTVEIISRLVISVELCIGFLIMIPFFHKFTYNLTQTFLLVMTIFLFYLLLSKGNNADCGCLGEYIKLSPFESILKNIALMALTFFVLRNSNEIKLNNAFKYVTVVLIFLSFSIPWIYAAPDRMYELPPAQLNQPMQVNILENFSNGESPEVLKSGKKIVCFFSTSCKFCRMAAKKITLFQKNSGLQLPVYYIFWDGTAKLNEFWEETQSNKYPYQVVPPDIFFPLGGNQLPAIYFLNEGVIVAKHSYRTLDEKRIKEFLSEH